MGGLSREVRLHPSFLAEVLLFLFVERIFFRGFIVALLSSWYGTEGLNLCLDDHGCCKRAVPGKLLSRKVYKRPPKMHIPERSLFVWIYERLWLLCSSPRRWTISSISTSLCFWFLLFLFYFTLVSLAFTANLPDTNAERINSDVCQHVSTPFYQNRIVSQKSFRRLWFSLKGKFESVCFI